MQELSPAEKRQAELDKELYKSIKDKKAGLTRLVRVKSLLDLGANPYSRHTRQKIPIIHILSSSGGWDLVDAIITRIILKKNLSDPALLGGVLYSAINTRPGQGIELIRKLLKAGAKVNHTYIASNKLTTILHCAVKINSPHTEELLSWGANPYLLDSDNKSPMDYALNKDVLDKKDWNLIKAMLSTLKHKPKNNVLNETLIKAALTNSKTSTSIIPNLLKAGANPNHTINGKNAITIAAGKRNLQLCQTLFSQGARATAKSIAKARKANDTFYLPFFEMKQHNDAYHSTIQGIIAFKQVKSEAIPATILSLIVQWLFPDNITPIPEEKSKKTSVIPDGKLSSLEKAIDARVKNIRDTAAGHRAENLRLIQTYHDRIQEIPNDGKNQDRNSAIDRLKKMAALKLKEHEEALASKQTPNTNMKELLNLEKAFKDFDNFTQTLKFNLSYQEGTVEYKRSTQILTILKNKAYQQYIQDQPTTQIVDWLKARIETEQAAQNNLGTINRRIQQLSDAKNEPRGAAIDFLKTNALQEYNAYFSKTEFKDEEQTKAAYLSLKTMLTAFQELDGFAKKLSFSEQYRRNKTRGSAVQTIDTVRTISYLNYSLGVAAPACQKKLLEETRKILADIELDHQTNGSYRYLKFFTPKKSVPESTLAELVKDAINPAP